jgi:hypothetical protein
VPVAGEEESVSGVAAATIDAAAIGTGVLVAACLVVVLVIMKRRNPVQPAAPGDMEFVEVDNN